MLDVFVDPRQKNAIEFLCYILLIIASSLFFVPSYKHFSRFINICKILVYNCIIHFHSLT